MGQLEKISSNQFRFSYNESWLKSGHSGIGLSIPLQKEPIEENQLFPFFDNLIPEGWLLSHAQNIYKIDKTNRFAILLATGRETVGAVKAIALDESNQEVKVEDITIDKSKDLTKSDVEFLPANNRCPYCLKPLTEKQLKTTHHHPSCALKMWGTTKKIKINLDSVDPLNSFRQTVYGGSISGAQRKGLFHFDAKANLIPTNKNSQYIIKPQGEYPYLPENEHVSMAIAKALGFEIPPFTIFNVEKVGMVFAIKRFDLTQNNDHLRLEDAAQILGIPSSDKYNSSYEKLAKAIKTYSDAPIADLFELWKRVLFSFFIGNGDMHLKNWSLIELDSIKGIFKLSPCYDFLNTRLPLYDEPIDLGLALGGQKHQVSKKLLVNFSVLLEIDHLTEDIFKILPGWMNITEDLVKDCYLPEDQKLKYIEIVRSRYEVLLGNQKKYL